MKYIFSYAFLAFYFFFDCYAQSSLDAHVHGEAELNIVFEGQELLIELESPSFNLVGFEHEPKTSDQHKLVENTIKLLKDFDSVANTSTEASCNIIDIKVSTTMRGVEDGHGEESTHQRITDITLILQYPRIPNF